MFIIVFIIVVMFCNVVFKAVPITLKATVNAGLNTFNIKSATGKINLS